MALCSNELCVAGLSLALSGHGLQPLTPRQLYWYAGEYTVELRYNTRTTTCGPVRCATILDITKQSSTVGAALLKFLLGDLS